MDDLEFEEALPLLSVDALEHDAATLSRRRFVLGTLALAGVGAVFPDWWRREADAATPVGANEGILVVVFLGGGNDGLDTLAPHSGAGRGRYEQLRGPLALPAGSLLDVGGGWGLHPGLGRLHARYGQGQVALVEGTGLPEADLSHFTAMAKVMQGSLGASSTGWLGRFLDGVPEADSGMRAMAVSSSVPLHLLGERAKVTSIPPEGTIWGADRSDPVKAALVDAVVEFGSEPTGLGGWADAVGATGRHAVAQAAWATQLVAASSDSSPAVRDLSLAARLVNADLGTRVVGVTLGGWDTHAGESAVHDALLRDLDRAIETFFATLEARFQRRVTMLVQSEFGRRPSANGSLGTDHGTANLMLLVGRNVRGGRHAAPPDLDRLDDRGNPAPTLDFRAVYAALLRRWLAADDGGILGAGFEPLDLFRADPGVTVA